MGRAGFVNMQDKATTWSLGYLGVAPKDIRRLAKVTLSYAPFSIRPEQIQIDITDRCNYRCPTCTKWLQKSAEHELTTEQWKNFLTRSARLPFSGRVVFAAGEPLLRPDLIELIQHATDLHLGTVVITNGSLLNESRLRALQDAGLNYLMVSLNGLDASVHDSSRETVGGFDTSFPGACGEDRELCDRRLYLDHRITYVPDARIFHSHDLNLRTFWKQHFNYGTGAKRYWDHRT
jgi:sulfatase maturation enzyme AslB (radical SAM superfamily)